MLICSALRFPAALCFAALQAPASVDREPASRGGGSAFPVSIGLRPGASTPHTQHNTMETTHTSADLYKVYKVFRVSNRREVLATGLTLEEARRMVQRFPDSSRSMVVFTKQS